MLTELITHLGFLQRTNPHNFEAIIPILHRINTILKTSTVAPATLTVKGIKHIVIVNTFKPLDFYLGVNATSSYKINGQPAIPCDKVNSAIKLHNGGEVTSHKPGFYYCSYNDKSLIDFNFCNETMKIWSRTGLLHKNELVHAYNYCINNHRITYIENLIARKTNSITLNKAV